MSCVVCRVEGQKEGAEETMAGKWQIKYTSRTEQAGEAGAAAKRCGTPGSWKPNRAIDWWCISLTLCVYRVSTGVVGESEYCTPHFVSGGAAMRDKEGVVRSCTQGNRGL